MDVDKTGVTKRLAEAGFRYSVSRPRRFGKALLTSTLEEFFRGTRALFQDLDAKSGIYHKPVFSAAER